MGVLAWLNFAWTMAAVTSGGPDRESGWAHA